VHAALGLVNVNLSDRRRECCAIRLRPGAAGEEPTLLIDYVPTEDERERIEVTLKRMRGGLSKLGCLVPPGMSHVRPMGASVHYSGTLPMATSGGRFTTTEEGRSRDFPNLWIADGSTFPFLPAKNLGVLAC
jgi:choline dehydrogenase-like flavoprotein